MAISEKIELLGKGLYGNVGIPDVLTLKAIPTASELDYVGGEDFQATMLDVIFPKAIEEQINFRQLLEIDFHWICRCLRILNYGPYYTTSTIYCNDCVNISSGEYQVDLRTVNVKSLPENFTNSIVIPKEEFLDYKGDIVLHLPTIQEMMNAGKDQLFADRNGDINTSLSRLCYMISSVGNNNKLTVIDIKNFIQNTLSPADFVILRDKAITLTDYGLRAGGTTICPKCHSHDAGFVALVDDRFFRPTVGDLRAWKSDRDVQRVCESTASNREDRERVQNISSDAPTAV